MRDLLAYKSCLKGIYQEYTNILSVFKLKLDDIGRTLKVDIAKQNKLPR